MGIQFWWHIFKHTMALFSSLYFFLWFEVKHLNNKCFGTILSHCAVRWMFLFINGFFFSSSIWLNEIVSINLTTTIYSNNNEWIIHESLCTSQWFHFRLRFGYEVSSVTKLYSVGRILLPTSFISRTVCGLTLGNAWIL